MRNIYIFILFLCSSVVMSQTPGYSVDEAQFRDLSYQLVNGTDDVSTSVSHGSLFPDYNFSDIFGVSHNIYSKLDAGKIVVLGFMEFSGALSEKEVKYLNHIKEIYQDQEDMIEFLSIEKTKHQNIALNVQDWYNENNLNYPLINLDGLDPFLTGQITGLPTFIIISPDKTFSKITGFSYEHHILSRVNQEILDAAGLNKDYDIDLFSVEHDFCGSSKNIYITLQNTGVLNSGTFTIKLYTDSNVLIDSLFQNISLPPNSRIEYGLYYPVNSLPYNDIVVEVVASEASENIKNNKNTFSLVENEVFSGTDITIKIQTDTYPEETAWTFMNTTTGQIIETGGLNTSNQIIGLQSGLHNYPQTLIENNCYTLQVYDSVGDGMCCNYGNGYIQIIDNTTGLVITEGGEFELSEKLHFRVNSMAIGIDEIQSQSEPKEIKKIQYFDMLGREFKTPISNTILVKKITFTDNSIKSEKIHLK